MFQNLVSKKSFWLVTLATVLAIALIAGFGTLSSVSASPAFNGPTDEHGNHAQYSNYPDNGLSVKLPTTVDRRSFFLGDTILMPNGLQIQVTKVDRSWQPPLTTSETLGKHQVGDNPKNKETILVWFAVRNTNTVPIIYNDSYFTLRGNASHDQRLANLATLPPTSYGSFTKNPWLLPGEATETFVPFLVNMGRQNLTFQYYAYPTSWATSKVTHVPCLIVHLSVRPVAQANATATIFTFSQDEMVTVNP